MIKHDIKLKNRLRNTTMFMKQITVIIAVAFATIITGCNRTPSTQSGNQTQKQDSSHTSPTRIISAAPLLTEVIFALGQQHKLVGRTDYCLNPAEASAITSIGSLMDPSIETIIGLKPDIVLTSTHFKKEVSEKINISFIKVHRRERYKPFAIWHN